jgi:purine-binding chemotaxis protein CheW
MSETAEAAGGTREIPDSEKYLIFSVLNRLYAFPSRFISEIALFDAVYPLPLMPEYVPGIINRYSVPYVLFDISLLLFKTPSPRGKVLVLKDDIDRIAFVIDDVTDLVDVPEAKLLAVERSAETNDLAELIVSTFNWNGADIFVLDIERLLSRVESEIAG